MNFFLLKHDKILTYKNKDELHLNLLDTRRGRKNRVKVSEFKWESAYSEKDFPMIENG